MQNENEASIADMLKAYRTDNYLTQAELAEKLGITRQSLARVECGIRNLGKKGQKKFSLLQKAPANQ